MYPCINLHGLVGTKNNRNDHREKNEERKVFY